MGGPKALLPIDGETFLARVCRLFARPGIDSVVAVLGAESERVRREAGLPAEASVVVNDGWREGMLTSVWRGLDEAEDRGADAILLHPVDHPLVEPETIDRVVEALRASAAIAVPTWEGRRGHRAGSTGRSSPRCGPPRRRAALAPCWPRTPTGSSTSSAARGASPG